MSNAHQTALKTYKKQYAATSQALQNATERRPRFFALPLQSIRDIFEQQKADAHKRFKPYINAALERRNNAKNALEHESAEDLLNRIVSIRKEPTISAIQTAWKEIVKQERHDSLVYTGLQIKAGVETAANTLKGLAKGFKAMTGAKGLEDAVNTLSQSVKGLPR